MVRRSTVALIAATATGLALAVPVAAAQPARPACSPSPRTCLPGLAHATDLGPAAAGTPMQLVVTVQRPNVTGEKSLLAAEHNPASASYQHFLTPSQFAAGFGVPASQRSAVANFLTAGGLTVDSVSTAGDVYSVHGTAAPDRFVVSDQHSKYSRPALGSWPTPRLRSHRRAWESPTSSG